MGPRFNGYGGMAIRPLAADSFGVRSFAWQVETEVVSVLIDPEASLGPRRDRYPPHREEYRALKGSSERIQEAGEEGDVAIVTHYHFDHYVPSFENWRYNWSSEERARSLFSGLTVLAKQPTEDINYSQKKRPYYFDRLCEEVAADLTYADGRTAEYRDLEIRFSPPVPHGPEGTIPGPS